MTVLAPAAHAAAPNVPPELRAHDAWAAPNGNLAGTRAAAGNRPRVGDAGRIRRVWRFTLPEEPTFSGVMSATPLVLGGRVYLQSLRSNVYALDAASGKLVWSRRFDRGSGGPNGLAAGYGRLYGATNTNVFALDRRTGRVLWSRRVTGEREQVDIAPAVARGSSSRGPRRRSRAASDRCWRSTR